MKNSRFAAYDPRYEVDAAPVAESVALGEKIGNIKDPDVVASLSPRSPFGWDEMRCRSVSTVIMEMLRREREDLEKMRAFYCGAEWEKSCAKD